MILSLPPVPQGDLRLKQITGSSDPLQFDEMGGSKAVTSRIAMEITHDGIYVNYTFVQVGILDDKVSYKGNCSDISAAVSLLAVDVGLADFRPGTSINPEVRARGPRL